MITKKLKKEVRKLVMQGLGRCKIAAMLDISSSMASKLIKAVREEEPEAPKPASGSHTMRDDVERLSNQGLSIEEIARELDISKSSVRYWISRIGEKSNEIDKIRTMIDQSNFNTYELAKKLKQNPNSINTKIKKAELTYDPAKDWIHKAAKTGVKFSTLRDVLGVKSLEKAEEVILENFPDCFVVRTKVGSDTVLTPVFDSKRDVESINIDTSKKPFKYHVSAGSNYMLLQVDDNYGEDRLVIPCLSDLHKGSVHHRPELLKYLIDWILSTPGCLPLLVGDLIENITKASVGGISEQYLSPNNQVVGICKDLAPIAHLIPCSIDGNHEQRTERFADFSTGRVIADILKVPFIPLEVVIDIHWRGITKRLLATHRFGKAYSIAQVEANVMKKREILGHFDFTFSGHNHKSFVLPEETLNIITGRGMEHVRWFILNNGSCVGRTGGYAENFPPAPQDMVYGIINEDGTIDGKSIPVRGI